MKSCPQWVGYDGRGKGIKTVGCAVAQPTLRNPKVDKEHSCYV